MPNPKTQKVGRPHLQRDQQQWIYDYIVQQSGAVFHWWSDGHGDLPKSVRSHAMISKHLGREGQKLEAAAAEEASAGHRDKALELYFKAVQKFLTAQHTIFEINGEKRFLNEALQRCYDKVREFSTYRIERVEIPWNGTVVSGYLHLCPEVGVAPCIFYMPGCDITAEGWPNPLRNPAIPVGMHVFSFDGPGLGQSNMRGIRLTSDNFEQAAHTALDTLVQRPEIDAEQIVTYGAGAGSFWAARFAALDHRVKAAATKSTYADMYYLMNEEGPRWKQLFAWLTQSASEEELDKVMDEMTLDGYMERIECPTLMVTGEYDLRDPVEEVFQIFDQLRAPHELWLFADQFHPLSLSNGPTTAELMLGWLRDRLDGKPLDHDGEVLYIERDDEGPFAKDVKVKRRWYEESR